MPVRRLPTLFLMLLAGMILPASFAQASYVSLDTRKFVDSSSAGYDYGYAPAIIYENNLYHMFYCSSGVDSGWDAVRYVTSRDRKTWSAPQTVLKVSNMSVERAVCDPSVVYYNAGDGPYFYLFYSGNQYNVQTVMFVARSQTINGPYAKYTQRGTWEVNAADPKVILAPRRAVPDDVATRDGWYGAGQQTVVVKQGRLYSWYWDDTLSYPTRSGKLMFTSTTNPTSWSTPVETNVNASSPDVKYDTVLNQFVMFDLIDDHQQQVALVRQRSADGITWQAADVVCAASCLADYSHNVGISGTRLGHFEPQTALVAYGAPYDLSPRYANTCQSANPNAAGYPPYCWGRWDMYGGLLPPNVYGIEKTGSGTGRTRVHAIDLLPTLPGSTTPRPVPAITTALEETGSDNAWMFALGDYNNDGKQDLYGVKKMYTGSGKTEVHILDGATGYQSFLLHAATNLGLTGTDQSWVYALGDYNGDGKLDLYSIARANTGSGKTEVHILNGADNFQSFLLNAVTAQGPTGSNGAWAFALGDYNADGKLDLYSIAKANTGSGKTEVHILNGADNFQTFLLNTATALGLTGSDGTWIFSLGDYNRDGNPDLYGVAKNTSSGRAEVHILSGAGNFQSFLVHSTTGLGQTGNDWRWSFVQ